MSELQAVINTLVAGAGCGSIYSDNVLSKVNEALCDAEIDTDDNDNVWVEVKDPYGETDDFDFMFALSFYEIGSVGDSYVVYPVHVKILGCDISQASLDSISIEGIKGNQTIVEQSLQSLIQKINGLSTFNAESACGELSYELSGQGSELSVLSLKKNEEKLVLDLGNPDYEGEY